ncbi:MAG: class I SAM-dependent methyltransferase [Anaerolineales bacterium]
MVGVLRAIMRFFFRVLYNEFAWTYDLVSRFVSMGQWRSWQRTTLNHLRGKRVLEIGHGTGNMLLDLTALGFEPVGLDLSRAMGRIASIKIQKHGLSVPLARAHVRALPFADGAFPSLLATFPTEFIIAPAAIAEFKRVLQSGGVLVFVPVAQITGPAWRDRFAEWLFRVTGESATDWFAPLLARYADAGFTARLERVALPRSVVTLVIAEKQ